MGIIASLTGSWSLRRRIDNGAAMIGAATFAARDDGGFDYHERGRLSLADGQTINAERRYVFEDALAGFVVWFTEDPPRLFHRVVLAATAAGWAGTTAHLCGNDRYDSDYEFRAGGSFAIRHRVQGPRKDYTISTDYSRSRPRLAGSHQPGF